MAWTLARARVKEALDVESMVGCAGWRAFALPERAGLSSGARLYRDGDLSTARDGCVDEHPFRGVLGHRRVDADRRWERRKRN